MEALILQNVSLVLSLLRSRVAVVASVLCSKDLPPNGPLCLIHCHCLSLYLFLLGTPHRYPTQWATATAGAYPKGPKSGLSAGPPSFWGILFTRVFLLMLKRFRSVPLMGGRKAPRYQVSWGSSSEDGGAAHGPLHPALLTSKLSGLGVSSELF